MNIFGILVGFLWSLSALGQGVQFDYSEFPESPQWPYCEETIEFYDINQETPLGFSGADLFKLTNNVNSVKINYSYKSAQTVGSLNFGQVSSISRYIRSKAVYPEQGYAIGIICTDRVELDVSVSFISQDGSFMDSWDTTLRSEERSITGEPQAGEYAQFAIFLGPEDFKGSFYQDAPQEWMGGVFSGQLTPNELSAQISHSDCYCDDSSCITSQVLDVEIESFIPYGN